MLVSEVFRQYNIWHVESTRLMYFAPRSDNFLEQWEKEVAEANANVLKFRKMLELCRKDCS